MAFGILDNTSFDGRPGSDYSFGVSAPLKINVLTRQFYHGIKNGGFVKKQFAVYISENKETG